MQRKNTTKTKGNASRYISRAKAVRKLNLSLPTFRTLCIYKGIYPRDPGSTRKKFKNSSKSKTYYYKKEILHLINDPILSVLRQQRIYARKLTRLINDRKWLEVKRLENCKPVVALDQVIKERYPTFADALRGLNDCLTLIFSVSHLAGMKKMKEEDIRLCSILGLEFKNYVVKTRCLRKVFVTIKGFYYQVNILNTLITWSDPFSFVHSMPDKMDIRIINTFLQLYTTLLRFVLIHLYRSAGIVYPPKINLEENNLDSGLSELIVESSLASLVSEVQGNETTTMVLSDNKEKRKKLVDEVKLITSSQKRSDEDDLDACEGQKSPDIDLSNAEGQIPIAGCDVGDDNDWKEVDKKIENLKNLFSSCCFFLSRETPKASLEFVIRSCGGICGWDQYGRGKSHMDENSVNITHHVVDRRLPPSKMLKNRFYVQPQWVYDCVNSGKLLDVNNYLPNKPPPPHLSPFVVYGKQDYVPEEAENDITKDGSINLPSQDINQSIEENQNSKINSSEDGTDNEYELYKAELIAESKGMKLSEYMESKLSQDSNSIQINKDVITHNIKVLDDNKSKDAVSKKKELDKERKELAVSLLSKRNRRRYEMLSRKQKKHSKAVETLKHKKMKLKKSENQITDTKQNV